MADEDNGEGNTSDRPDTSDTSQGSDATVVKSDASGSEVPADVVAAAQVGAQETQTRPSEPAWLGRWVWQSLWKVVAVGLAVLFFGIMAWRAQHLLRLLGLSVFFALALIPGVNHLHEKRGWKRGAAVGVIYAMLVLAMVLMVVVLIPGIANFASEVGKNGNDWIANLNSESQDLFGKDLIGQGAGDNAVVSTDDALKSWSDNIAGAASTGLGLVFDIATMALFTFYFAADWPRIQRAMLSRMPPHRQKVTGWVTDTAIEQTGGYFYSRLLLMVINGSLFFVVMMLVGMPVVYALPMSIFEGFVAEFIPAVGTYIGAAVPILITLAVQGFGAALILLVWTLIYQQGENYWLSPKLSAKTMSINGGVAFGSALFGGAIAGPMGAFMALPIAALITSIISNTGKSYAVVYDSRYDTASEKPSDDEGSATAAPPDDQGSSALPAGD